MDVLFDAVSPTNFPNLFTTLWVGALVICFGASVVYYVAQRRYRRYPVLVGLHEWVYWSILVPWILVPLLVVIHVPLLLILILVVPGMGLAAWMAFVRFPPRIAAANDEIRRRRYVPPPRRDVRSRGRPTPTGGHKTHRR